MKFANSRVIPLSFIPYAVALNSSLAELSATSPAEVNLKPLQKAIDIFYTAAGSLDTVAQKAKNFDSSISDEVSSNTNPNR
jgi:hypothetical protein